MPGNSSVSTRQRMNDIQKQGSGVMIHWVLGVLGHLSQGTIFGEGACGTRQTEQNVGADLGHNLTHTLAFQRTAFSLRRYRGFGIKTCLCENWDSNDAHQDERSSLDRTGELRVIS